MVTFMKLSIFYVTDNVISGKCSLSNESVYEASISRVSTVGPKTFIFVGEIMGLHDVVPEKRVKGGF